MQSKNTYTKTASHEAIKGSFDTCLLLYSGGLDTSTMLKWIQDEYQCQVITLTINLGQTADDLKAIQKKALDLGAKDAFVYDAQEEFADTIITEAIKANADYQGGYALSTPLGRVMIAKVAVNICEQYNCSVVAHGCTGKGNDQVRFEGYITTLNPNLKTIAPVREWSMGRDEQIEFCKIHNIPVKQTKDKPYSYDENMWGNTGEGGEIENPELEPKLHQILQWCQTPEQAPDEPAFVEVEFFKGIPIAINGHKDKLMNLIADLNKIGSLHAIGIFPLIEDRFVGLKVRGVYENPGATILIEAHKKLEKLVSTREENELKSFIDTKWAYLCYAAKWYDPVMYHINAFINSMNKKVSGNVKVKLYKGQATVVSLSSPHSLFDENLSTFNKSGGFNQNAAAGFIELWNLPQKTAYGMYNWESELNKN
ncbi:argininosuccinate synthase [bacterium]|nr:argininosuccinate synthase [bacterium]NCQ55523.1 argininosuccinate synthase [Candidatus Parcubacteria bacterium]NCS67534.1 argininosuccinate synthase [Candidatus Peregrinibacteria bacterium]NCS96301.1 argininosuccinate synthase [bacterium]